MKVACGTSGWSYPPWRGSFYPEKHPTAKMLAFYGERLGTVEVNNTFYRMPKEEVLRGWAAEVPATFRFALKSPQRITHQLRLADAADSVLRFATVARALGAKIGPILFQLPPFLRKDAERLRSFLGVWKDNGGGLDAAFEFRHASWFDDEVFGLLRDHGVALCLAEGESIDTPVVATAGWGYLRLRKVEYTDAELDAWVGRIRQQAWAHAYVYFKHEDGATGPRLAADFMKRLGSDM